MLTLGALVGALTLRWHPGLGLALAAVTTLAVAAVGTLAWSARTEPAQRR